MSKEEIMVLDAEQIEARKAELKDELQTAETNEAMDAIKAENDLLEERKAQIKLEVEKRKADMAAVVKGQGDVIEEVKDERTVTKMEVRNTPEYINAYAEYIKSGNDMECRKLTSENEILFVDCCGTLFMYYSKVSADLELYLQVALQIALANERHDAFSFPCGFYYVVNELRNGYSAGSVWSCVVLACQLSALHVVSALDVLSICVDVLRCVSYFHCCDFPFVFNFFDDIALSLDDSSHVKFPLFDFELDNFSTLSDSVEFIVQPFDALCISLTKLVNDLSVSLIDLLDVKSHNFFACHAFYSFPLNIALAVTIALRLSVSSFSASSRSARIFSITPSVKLLTLIDVASLAGIETALTS